MTMSTGAESYFAPPCVDSFQAAQREVMEADVPLHFQLPPTKKVRVMMREIMGCDRERSGSGVMEREDADR